MMISDHTDGFWTGGKAAWWRGLNDALRAAKRRLKNATTDEARAEASSHLDELECQKADAKRNSGRWLH